MSDKRLYCRVLKLRTGVFKVDIDSVRGMGTDTIGYTRSSAITQALRQLSKAEGVAPGLCLGCEKPLEDVVGAYIHVDCIEIVDSEEADPKADTP